MTGKISTNDNQLSAHIFDEGVVQIESPRYKGLGIEIRFIDPTQDAMIPQGAVYKLKLYKPEPIVNDKPLEDDMVYITAQGKIINPRDK